MDYSPENLDAWLVFADALCEEGDPWGEVIAVQCQSDLPDPCESDPGTFDGKSNIGSLDPNILGSELVHFAEHFSLVWWRGVIRQATLRRTNWRDFDVSQAVEALLSSRTTFYLGHLRIVAQQSRSDDVVKLMMSLLAEPRPSLKTLTIAMFGDDEPGYISWKLNEALPNLRYLYLGMDRTPPLYHDRLYSLRVSSSLVYLLPHAVLPQLEKLGIKLDGHPLDPLEQIELPMLHELQAEGFGHEELLQLTQFPWFPNIDALTLVLYDNLRVIEAVAPQLRRLQRLTLVTQWPVDEERKRAIEAAVPGIIVGWR